VSASTPWLVLRPGAPPSPRPVRLYCFPYAGGHAGVFMPWQAGLDPDIEVCAVQMPGRSSRLREPAMTTIPELVESVAEVIARHGDERPFAFFGHSLGALVAFEIARYNARHGLPQPSRLLVSGCEAPAHRGEPRNLHLLDDDALLDRIKSFNGTPPEVLANRELSALILSVMRTDFALEPGYFYEPGPKLEIPVTALAGTEDRHGRWQDVDRWSEETCAEFRLHWFQGDHFFLNSRQDAVIACVKHALGDLVSAALTQNASRGTASSEYVFGD
jgi:surfactin synthase thioesterase subunit